MKRLEHMKRRLAIGLLEHAERLFLRAHGFELVKVFGRVVWMPPTSGYKFKYRHYQTRGHAVNALKQSIYNPMWGGKRSEQPG